MILYHYSTALLPYASAAISFSPGYIHLSIAKQGVHKFRFRDEKSDQKSVNLEYNTLVRWTHETNVLLTKRLMFQVFFFFIKSCKILCKNIFIFFFNFLYKITKMKQNTSEHPKPMTNNEKKNTWNVKHLVENLFVPSA